MRLWCVGLWVWGCGASSKGGGGALACWAAMFWAVVPLPVGCGAVGCEAAWFGFVGCGVVVCGAVLYGAVGGGG